MSLLWMIFVGFVAGLLAKAITPGTKKEPSGCLWTTLLGIAGSIVVGSLMDLLGIQGSGGTIATIFGATIGAVGLILLARKFWK